MNSRFRNSKSANLEKMRLKDLHVYKEDLLMKIIYKCKKATPNNFYFYLIFFILKILGNLIISHNFRRENLKSDFSINKILRVFTFFNEFSLTTTSLKNYDLICIAIFLFSVFPIILLFIIYKALFKLKLKYIKIPKHFSYLIKFNSLLITILVLLSQYLLEILYFIIAHTIAINNITMQVANKTENLIAVSETLIPFFYSFESNLTLSKYFFILLNSLSILIINLTINYYFVFINEPFLNSKASVRIYHNKTYLFFLVISFNFQALHYFEFLFKDSEKFSMRVILLIISLVTNFYFLIDNIANYNFRIFYNNFLDIVFSICFVSCLLDFIVYYSYPHGIDAMQNLFKLVVEVVSALILNFSLNEYKKKRLIRVLNSNLFSKNKKICLNSLFVFTDLIQLSLANSVNFLPVFRMIDQHKIKCQAEECPCEKYEFNNYLKNFEVNRDIAHLKDEEKLNYFKKMYHDIITLAENEIVNMIYQYYKGKEINGNYNLFLLHVDYIFHFKRNHLFSNYLIEQYSLNIKSLPFLYKFYFFIYKKLLIKQHYECLYKKSVMAVNANFLEFFKYYRRLEKINKLVYKNCENFEKLIYIKKTFDNNRLNSGSRDASMDLNYKKLFHNVERIFALCENLNKHYSQLTDFLNSNFKTQRLRNIEASYVLYNFFLLINKEIPFDIRSFFLQIDSYAMVESHASSYAEKKICHPLIVNVNRSDSFLIKYASQKLCDLIDYTKKELIDEDIHLLVPSLFKDQHKTVLKKLIFLEYESKIFKESFLITKQQFYFPIHITSSFLPTLNENTLLILDIFPLKENPHSKTNIYKFILDSNANFITFSKNFVDNFNVNLQMFNKLKISFCHFFNINLNQMLEKFNNAVDFIEKIDLSRTNTIMKIFQHVDLMNALEFLNEGNILRKKFNVKNSKYAKTVDFIRKKEKLIPTLIKIRKKIQEDEIENEYLQIINEIEKKFYRHTSANKILNMKKIITRTLGKSINNAGGTAENYNYNNINNNLNESNLCNNLNINSMLNISNNNRNNYPGNLENNVSDNSRLVADSGQNIQAMGIDQFYVRFHIHNMGNIPYFYVELYERKETEIDFANLYNLQMNLNEIKTQHSLGLSQESHKSLMDLFKFEIPQNTITNEANNYPATTLQFNNTISNNIPGITINNNNFTSQATQMNNNYINNLNANTNSSNGFINLKFNNNQFSFGNSNSNSNNSPNFSNVNNNGNTNNNKEIVIQNYQNLNSIKTSYFKESLNGFNPFNNLNNNLDNANPQNNPNSISSSKKNPNHFHPNNLNKNLHSNNDNSNNFYNLNNNSSNNLGALGSHQNTNKHNESLQHLLNLNFSSINKSSLKGTTIANPKGNQTFNLSVKTTSDFNPNLALGGMRRNAKKKKTISVLETSEQQKGYFKEKIIFIFLFALLFIQIFLAFFSFFFKNEIANVSFDLFNINYYAMLTKLSIYYTSSSAISACSYVDIDPKQVDNFFVEISDYKKNFKLRSDELLSNLHKFMNFLSASDASQINEIMGIISEPRQFRLLYTDWTSYFRNSNILDEMSYYHYYIAGLNRKDTFAKCRLRQFFYEERFEKAVDLSVSGTNYNHNSGNSEESFLNPNLNSSTGNQKNINDGNSNKNNINNNNKIKNDGNNINSQIANFEESVLYYIVYNVFQVFRERLELITLKINNKLINYHNDSQTMLVVFNLITLFFALSLILIVVFSVRNYRTKIIDMIFSIFIKDKADKNFEEKLINFKTIVKDFDRNVCFSYEENCKKLLIEESIQFEENLRVGQRSKNINARGKHGKGNRTSNGNYYGKETAKDRERVKERYAQSKKRTNFTNAQVNSIANFNTNNNYGNINNNDIGIDLNTAGYKKINNNNNSFSDLGVNNNNAVNNYQNLNLNLNNSNYLSASGLTNNFNTNNNSSINLIGNSNNNSDKNNSNVLNCEPNNNNKIGFSSNKNSNNTISSLDDKSEEANAQQGIDLGNISMKIIRFSYLVLLIAFICYMIISISNILINNREYKKLVVANQISVNFLDRIPKFAELILYYKISVLFNNINFVTTKSENYADGIYSNHFNATYNMNSDTIFRELKESEYAHIYYKLKIIRKNIDLFMGSKEPLYTQVLRSLRDYESKLNSQEFCLVYSTLYILSSSSINGSSGADLLQSFNLLNQEVQECMRIGNGLNKYGLNLAIDTLLASANNLYLDFSRAQPAANITATLTDLNFLRAVLNVEYTFQKANSNYLKLILTEMTLLYDQLRNIEYVYSFVGLFFNLLFIVIVIFGVIKKLQRYFISLGSAIDKFKVALIAINNQD